MPKANIKWVIHTSCLFNISRYSKPNKPPIPLSKGDVFKKNHRAPVMGGKRYHGSVQKGVGGYRGEGGYSRCHGSPFKGSGVIADAMGLL